MSDYTIENGFITDPGKFEGEPEYAPYFYDNCDDGEILATHDEQGFFFALVPVRPQEQVRYPALRDIAYIGVTERTDGFVIIDHIETEQEAQRIRDGYISTDDDGE